VNLRVLLADDHPLVRTGLRELLATAGDLEVVGAAADGAEAIALAHEHVPDVVLMDLSMPGIGGAEAIRRLTVELPAIPIIALTSFSDRGRILEALDAGAVGYLLKDAQPDELVRGVRAAANGESPLAPRAASALLAARRESPPGAELSPRESEVLALVGEGLPNKLIARELGISEKTVKAHLTRVFAAIGVADRTAAALWAERHGVRRSPPA
jgi:DNA-binding NarL/FixJ family response regulator